MQNSGEEVRPPSGPERRNWQRNVRGENGGLPGSSQTAMNCTAPPQAFHFGSCYKILAHVGRGRTLSQALLLTSADRCSCAHGHPESARVGSGSTHMYRARCTATRAFKYQHSRARVHRHEALGPGAAGARGSWGELALASTLFPRAARSADPQRPLVLLPRLATGAPSPAIPVFADPSPALPTGRVFLLLGLWSPGLPLGRTCSRRRSRMQWGALRARASRPPQQPPGLAGSRMPRPPRVPLAVPRCPHRPHGGRLSQPEALQQGSTGAEKRRKGRVSPRAGVGRGDSLQSAVVTAPPCSEGSPGEG